MSAAVDLIVVNADVKTMDPDRPRAEAIAVAGSEIVAVGDNDTIRDLQTHPATRVIDAQGATVLPGFIEGHMHLFSGAAELSHLQLFGVRGLEALSTAIRGYAASNPHRPMLLGQGADYTVLGDRPVTRHDLDRIVPDRLFAMAAPDHHTMWANTSALEAAGILHGRAVGPGNEIVMGDDGLALGELRENEAFTPILALAKEERARLGLSTGGEPDPAPSPSERDADRDIMQQGLAWCARHGITSIQNMDGNFYQLELLTEIEAAGDLICRTRMPFHFRNFMELSDIDKADAMARRYKSEWLASGTVKLFYDGVIESSTAVLVEPYADKADWRGEPLFSPQRFAEIATEIDRRGLQIAVHAIGDGAVRAVLDGYEAAQKMNGRRDSRHRVEHIELIHPDDIPRFRGLGALASMQPTHAPGATGVPLEPTLSRLGRQRWPYAFALRTLADAGAPLVFASDWPVAPIDPLLGIQAAMQRRPWEDGMADESLSLEEAIAVYTTGGAYAEFMEHRKGLLKPGYLADLVVLSQSIEGSAAEALSGVEVRMTICGGRVTYEV